MKSASLPSSPENRLSRRDIFVLALAVLLTLAVYLLASAYFFRPGFPLDDAWIHQTYARNLALRGEWAFLPGQTSGGSTSPLWTLILVPGFWLRLSPLLWADFLGASLLLILGITVELILRRIFSTYHPTYPWAGLLFILEWHLAWAAFSGMETLLHILLITLVCGLLLTGSRRYLLMGLLTGIALWVRPDGSTLLGPLVLTLILEEKPLAVRLNGLVRLLIGFGALLAPYLLFNLVIAGTPLPNTFYAKQTEYASWQASPALDKLLTFALQFFSGITLPLLPGIWQSLVRAWRSRNGRVLAVLLWLTGYITLYVARLPVYQHGRYIMPALAVYLLLALTGWLSNPPPLQPGLSRLAYSFALVFLVVALLAGFLFGAVSFGTDTALIESQMVEISQWVNQNLPAGALVAAHDIGALGYFSQVNLFDLAGLISPEIVPIMMEDGPLQAAMDTRGVAYLIIFPGWRPALTARGEFLYSAGSQFQPRAGLGSLSVYRWKQP